MNLIKIIILFAICFVFTKVKAQKLPIDRSIFDKWNLVDNAIISNDGKYVVYNVSNASSSLHELVFQAVNSNWKLVISTTQNAISVLVTNDSKKAVFMKTKDSLCIVSLGNSKVDYISGVSSFKISRGNYYYLAYTIVSETYGLYVFDLITNSSTLYNNVENYWFSNDGKNLVLKNVNVKKNIDKISVDYIDLLNNKKPTRIWEGQNTTSLVFDRESKQLAFIAENGVSSGIEKALWYYKFGTDKAIKLTDKVHDVKCFSYDGVGVFVTLKERKKLEDPNQNSDIKLDIWSYTDSKLKSEQLQETDEEYAYVAYVSISNKRIIQLESQNETWQFDFISGKKFETSLLVAHENGKGGRWENNWNENFKKAWYLVNLKTGIRKQIHALDSLTLNPEIKLSPEGKYIIYFNGILKSFFCYEIETGITRDITSGISTHWAAGYTVEDTAVSNYYARGVAGWTINDEAVLLYDKNDIWKIDPLGNAKPINLTNGYGYKFDIVFNLTFDRYENRGIYKNERLILSAFNAKNKDNGFYSKRISDAGDPEMLTMGPYIYYIPNHSGDLNGKQPVKAKDKNIFIVRREDARNSANYFTTTDFKSYTQLTNLNPEKEYNWYTTELHTWIAPGGVELQGILYKPENFDSTKKYPVIFHYYEKKSDDLNGYLKPEDLCNGCAINIPSYVSNGYLVFTPDIHFKQGETGKSALIAVTSAAEYLSKLTWVDRTKMGLQGCSFGGFLTNYIITHSNMFAAACTASGGTDFISYYGDLLENGPSQQAQFETGQYRIGATLWDKPNLYIDNSPVLRANHVTTPLLIMATKSDGVVPPTQSIEFFTGLRRLRKKVWMLRYENGNHFLLGKEATDFSIRMNQFFDYYLKGLTSPKWMD